MARNPTKEIRSGMIRITPVVTKQRGSNHFRDAVDKTPKRVRTKRGPHAPNKPKKKRRFLSPNLEYEPIETLGYYNEAASIALHKVNPAARRLSFFELKSESRLSTTTSESGKHVALYILVLFCQENLNQVFVGSVM